MHFDDALNFLGDFGRYQKIQYFLLVALGIPAGIHTMVNVWLAYLPHDYRCFIPELDNSTSDPYYKPNLNLSIPLEHDYDRHCKYYKRTGNASLFEITNETVSCSEYIYDTSEFEKSAAMQFNLVCDHDIRNSIWQSLYMGGLLIGAVFFGTLSDKIGRKKVLIICTGLVLVVGVACAFMPEYFSFAVFRVLVAACNMGFFLTAFVMGMELLGDSVRTACGVGFQITFAIGYVFLAGMAYWLRDWQYLQISVTIFPGVFALAYWWLIPESIRWDLIKGNEEKAQETVKRASVVNNVEIPSWVFEKGLSQESNKADVVKTEKAVEEKTYTAIDLFRTPNLRCRTLNLCFNWFVESLVYYGLSLGSGNLGGDPYLNFFLLGISDFPGLIIAIYGMKWIGRKWTLCLLLVVGGIACVLTYPLAAWNVAVIALSMVGKVCIAGSFATVYNLSAELYPTQLRNNGMGISSMCSRIGGIVAPLVANVDKMVTSSGTSLKGFSTILFGCFALVAGLLSLLFPETKGKSLPETIEDAENFGKKIEDMSEVNDFELNAAAVNKDGQIQEVSNNNDISQSFSSKGKLTDIAL